MNRGLLIAFLALCTAYPGLADADSYNLEDITVTGTRLERYSFEIPGAISVITQEEIRRRSLGTATDLLNEEPGIQVQKTTSGHGSPIIRGLTGYQTLILVDGVRLNNSTFRSGPNQYMATIDSGQIERMEVMCGYGSTLYGSSAMGGVINVITRSSINASNALSFHPRIISKYSSADNGKYARLELSGGYKNFSLIAGGSYKDVDDLNPGKGYDIQLPNKKFIIISQEDPENLPEGAWLVDKLSPTGWEESNGDLKLDYKSDRHCVRMAYQSVRQKDVDRYDKLGDKEYDIFKYDPQNRDLMYINYTAKDALPFANFLQTSISYHIQDEGQKQQKAKSKTLKELRDTTNTFGLSVQIDKSLGNMQKLTYGGELYHDTVDSRSVSKNLEDGSSKQTRWGTFPDGSTYLDANMYLQDSVKLMSRLELIISGRYMHYNTESDLGISDPAFGVFEDSGDAMTGNLGLVYGIAEWLNLTFNAGQAFRAPNLNDTTAIAVTNEGIDAPNPDLGSERSKGIDIGFKTRSEYFSGSVNYYYSKVSGLVTRIPIEEAYSGKELPELYESIQKSYEGIPIFVKGNINKANIQGLEIAMNWLVMPMLPSISAYGNLTFTRGDDLTNNQPIRREPPTNGLIGLRWKGSKDRFWVEAYSRFAARQDRLSDGDRRDPRVPGLTTDPTKYDHKAYNPGWFTLNIRSGISLTEWTSLAVGVENIANRRYREYGSGVDAPGINFVANIDYGF